MQGGKNAFLFIDWLHRFPSAPLGLESQAAPGKVLASLRMEYGMMPVSSTGTRANLPNMDVMGITYSTWDCKRLS